MSALNWFYHQNPVQKDLSHLIAIVSRFADNIATENVELSKELNKWSCRIRSQQDYKITDINCLIDQLKVFFESKSELKQEWSDDTKGNIKAISVALIVLAKKTINFDLIKNVIKLISLGDAIGM